MTVIAVLADPPRPGLVLPNLPASSPLSASEAADLYAAMLKDTFRAAERSGGDLLVNYRSDDAIPDEYAGEESTEAELRALAADALADPSDARFEVQVGSSFSARAGNTVTHLLEEEDVQSVAVVRGTAPTLARTQIDSAAMKLRRNEVVLGPGERGRVHFAGFTAPVDFEDAYAAPEIETLARRGADAGLDVGFMPAQTRVETGADLVSLVPVLNARVAAGRAVPEHTAGLLGEWGVRVADGEDGLGLVRE